MGKSAEAKNRGGGGGGGRPGTRPGRVRTGDTRPPPPAEPGAVEYADDRGPASGYTAVRRSSELRVVRPGETHHVQRRPRERDSEPRGRAEGSARQTRRGAAGRA